MIRTGIVGGTGYTAGELIRILLNHPDVALSWVHSQSSPGMLLSDVHQGLAGETYMRFADTTDWDEIDVLFSCLPHGVSGEFLSNAGIPDRVKIIDLSADFRDQAQGHGYVYGLPELNRKAMVRGATRVACPGCLAMGVELALLPLAKNLLINSPVHITTVTGSTTAGSRPQPHSHYSYRNENMTVYRPFDHSHQPEIERTLKALQNSFDQRINHLPMRGPFSRGIITAVYLDCPVDLAHIRQLYEEYYADHNFTFVIDRMPDLKDVVGTNKCLIYLDKIDGRLLIVTVIDNLIKGASGTAVHNMNLLFGLSERTGLYLKATGV